MPTHKSIKALCRKLIDGDIYHATRLITLERHLEHELMPLLSTSGKKDIYHHIKHPLARHILKQLTNKLVIVVLVIILIIAKR